MVLHLQEEDIGFLIGTFFWKHHERHHAAQPPTTRSECFLWFVSSEKGRLSWVWVRSADEHRLVVTSTGLAYLEVRVTRSVWILSMNQFCGEAVLRLRKPQDVRQVKTEKQTTILKK